MLNLVVFSKDRACQLDLLLRSLRTHLAWLDPGEISVLYAHSTAPYARGYETVRALHPGVRFVAEADAASFRDATLALVDTARPLTTFLVDDDVLLAGFSLDDPELARLATRPELACVSLRLAPRIDYCYSLDRPAPPPELDADRTWAWPGAPGDWAYPMSLDGHVFRTVELLPLLEQLPFSNPNSLEAVLAEHPLPLPRSGCYEEPRLLNVPANRVQDTAPNRHGSIPAELLNDRFLAGERIAAASLDGVVNRAPHHELDYVFEPYAAPAAAPAPVPLRRGRPRAQVGLLVIATADYLPFATEMIESARTHLLPGHRIVPFLFSDGLLGDRVGFPAATLYRYHVFCEHRERLAAMDYLFYADADMLFVDRVGEEILGRLVATAHPGYVGTRGTYEDRPESTACVAPGEGEHYFCGGFNGGEAGAFLGLAETIAARIDTDDRNGIVAVWHDESHLNRYLVDNPPETILSPSYCYPEVLHPHYRALWPVSYPPKLVALDKSSGRRRLVRAA